MAMKFQCGLLFSPWSANFQYHLCSAQMPRDGNIVWKPIRDWAPKPNSQVSVGELKCLTWLAVWSPFNSPRSEIWFETLGSQSGSTRDNAPWKLRNIIDMTQSFLQLSSKLAQQTHHHLTINVIPVFAHQDLKMSVHPPGVSQEIHITAPISDVSCDTVY